MKKFTGFVLLMLMMGTAVFAQNLTLSGYFNSGLGVVMAGDEDPFLKAFGVDSESNGYRFRLNGSYQSEAKNAGARFRFQSQRTLAAAVGADTVGYFSIPYAYGFVNFFENKLGFSAGIVDDGTWTTADWWFNDDVGEGLGVLMKINPIDGLNLGFGAYTVSQKSGGSNNVLAKNLDTRVYLKDAKYTIGVSYTLKDTFYIGGTFRTENTAGGGKSKSEEPDVTLRGNFGTTVDGNKNSSLLVGDIRFLAIKGLTAVVAAAADNLQDFSDNGLMFFSETFAYKITDDFNLGLNAVQFLYQQEDTDAGLLFNLWGSYAFGSIVPRLDLVYFINGTSNGATKAEAEVNPNYHRRGYDPNSPKSSDQEYSVFSIRPSIKINLDNRTHFEIGNVTHIDMAKEKLPVWDDSKQRITNAFYFDFKWNF